MGEPQESKRAVIVSVAERDGFAGWNAAGQFWANGSTTETELTDAQIENLIARPGIVVIDKESGRAIRKANTPTVEVTFVERVTADERKALEEYRAKNANKAETKPIAFSLGKNPSSQEGKQDSPPPQSDLGAPAGELPHGTQKNDAAGAKRK